MTMLLFSVIALLILTTGPIIFGEIGTAITAFFVGFAGYFIYPVFLLLIVVAVSLVAGKKLVPTRWLVRPMLLVAAVFFIVHTATDGRFFYDASAAVNGYGAYLSGCWNAATENVAAGTGGGVLFGLIAYPVRFLLSEAGAYVLYSVLTLAALVYVLFLTPFRGLVVKPVSDRLPKRTEGGEGELSFDDLPAPSAKEAPVPTSYAGASSYPPADRAPQPPRPAPMPQARPAAPVSAADAPQTDAQRRSRDILFGGTAAERYRNNLIFDENSAFNTRPRGSSLMPNPPADTPNAPASPYTPVGPTPYTPAPGYTPPAGDTYPHYTPAPGYTPPAPRTYPAPGEGQNAGYTNTYSEDAEKTRPSMPRKNAVRRARLFGFRRLRALSRTHLPRALPGGRRRPLWERRPRRSLPHRGPRGQAYAFHPLGPPRYGHRPRDGRPPRYGHRPNGRPRYAPRRAGRLFGYASSRPRYPLRRLAQ